MPELGLGQWQVLRTKVRSVLAHRCDWEGSAVVALHNFSPVPCEVELEIELDDLDEPPAVDDLLGFDGFTLEEPVLRCKLEGYGYRWYRVRRPDQRPSP